MILDLSPVMNFEGKKVNFDAKLGFENASDLGFDFQKPAEVSGSIVNIGGSLELSAKVRASLIFECDRCCEEFIEDFECSFTEVLKKESGLESDDKNPDAIYFEGNSLELDDIVLNNILVELPLKHLCKASCKGLCADCGQNLNHGECKCDTRTSDPRFDVLDKFFE